MIATVGFFAETGVQEGMLVSDVWTAVVHKRVREVFVLTEAQAEFVKFVGSVQCRSEEGMEEACLFWGGQGRQWGYWRVSWFAFIPRSGRFL